MSSASALAASTILRVRVAIPEAYSTSEEGVARVTIRLDLRHVPYRGSAPGIQDLLGGQVAAFSSPIGDYLQYLKSGKLRLLATSGATRSRFAPDVPTYAEQGFKGLTMAEWYGFFLPGKAAREPAAEHPLVSAGVATGGHAPSMPPDQRRWRS